MYIKIMKKFFKKNNIMNFYEIGWKNFDGNK